MNVFLFSFNAILPMLAAMFLGVLLSVFKNIKESDKDFLNTLCFRYLLPIHLFNSVSSIDFYAEFKVHIIIFCIIAIIFIAVTAWIIFTIAIKDRGRRCIFIIASYRSNNLIFAMPLAANLFGTEGTKIAAMLVPVTIIMYNLISVVVFIYHSQEASQSTWLSIKNTFVDITKNPLIIGSILGIAFSLLRITLPVSLHQGISSIAATATPISFVLLGAQINLKVLNSNIRPALALCCMRLIIVPAIITPIMVLVGFRGAALGALMVAFAAPCAVATMVMAHNYKTDPVFAAQAVYLSSALSIITMFFLISVLKALTLI
ncbi:transporter [Spirochaetia bacterium]|nr:transporter [Spirochaetia bacterium]